MDEGSFKGSDEQRSLKWTDWGGVGNVGGLEGKVDWGGWRIAAAVEDMAGTKPNGEGQSERKRYLFDRRMEFDS